MSGGHRYTLDSRLLLCHCEDLRRHTLELGSEEHVGDKVNIVVVLKRLLDGVCLIV